MSAGASLDPRDKNWEKALEIGPSGLVLPDCRLSPLERERVRYQQGRLILDQVYCASCGKPWGGVTPDCPHVFYICQECTTSKPLPAEIVNMMVPGTEKL